jgi:hypothetical protein
MFITIKNITGHTVMLNPQYIIEVLRFKEIEKTTNAAGLVSVDCYCDHENTFYRLDEENLAKLEVCCSDYTQKRLKDREEE